jgi:hypothetical protein
MFYKQNIKPRDVLKRSLEAGANRNGHPAPRPALAQPMYFPSQADHVSLITSLCRCPVASHAELADNCHQEALTWHEGQSSRC